MAKRIIPNSVVKMIATRYNKGHNAKRIANSINGTATVKNLGAEYSHRSVAAIMANLTMGNYSR